MKNGSRDRLRINHILQAIKHIEEFTSSAKTKKFLADYLLQSAVTRQLEIIGEAVNAISAETKKKFPEVEWNSIKGFRNLLIHEYFSVDAAELWQTIRHDLPVLKNQMKHILKVIK